MSRAWDSPYDTCCRCGTRLGTLSAYKYVPYKTVGAFVFRSACEDEVACQARRDVARGRHHQWRNSLLPHRRRRARIATDYSIHLLEQELKTLDEPVFRYGAGTSS